MKRDPKNPQAVLLVTAPLVADATAVHAQQLLSGLTQARIEHPLLTPAPPGIGLLSKIESASVHAVEGLNWLGWRPFVFRKVLAWAREQEPALIHGLSEDAAPMCARLAEALQLPCVLTLQDYATNHELAELRRSGFCKALLVPSEPLREHAVNKLHFAREIVKLVPPGIQVGSTRRVQAAATEAGGEEPARRLVVSMGEFSRASDFATFIEAARHISNELKEQCNFVLAGEGARESALRRFTRELKLDKLATFCHGHTEAENLLREADVYVQTTRREGFAIRILQAMAQGVPVVAVTNGAVLELVTDGENGLIVPPANHALLAEKVLLLLKDAALAKRIGEAGRALVQAQYGSEAMMAGTLGIYREMTSV